MSVNKIEVIPGYTLDKILRVALREAGYAVPDRLLRFDYVDQNYQPHEGFVYDLFVKFEPND